MLSILSFKTICKLWGKKWDPKEKNTEQENVNQTTLDVEITINVNCWCQQNQEKCPTNIAIILNVLLLNSNIFFLNGFIF